MHRGKGEYIKASDKAVRDAVEPDEQARHERISEALRLKRVLEQRKTFSSKTSHSVLLHNIMAGAYGLDRSVWPENARMILDGVGELDRTRGENRVVLLGWHALRGSSYELRGVRKADPTLSVRFYVNESRPHPVRIALNAAWQLATRNGLDVKSMAQPAILFDADQLIRKDPSYGTLPDGVELREPALHTFEVGRRAIEDWAQNMMEVNESNQVARAVLSFSDDTRRMWDVMKLEGKQNQQARIKD